ncbi:MAG: nitroreductase [Candidatus Krumholzibacteriia bacterium]
MDVLELIRSRRTVRRFKSDPIPQAVLGEILEAAMWAPSHGNTQPWEFIAVGPQGRARLLALMQAKIDELLQAPDLPEPRRQAMLALREDFGGAPALIAVVSRPPTEELEKLEHLTSTGAAVQNLCLAAWARDIGSVWLSVGSAPPSRPILQVPDGATVVALLALGYPDQVPPAPPREAATTRLRSVP